MKEPASHFKNMDKMYSIQSRGVHGIRAPGRASNILSNHRNFARLQISTFAVGSANNDDGLQRFELFFEAPETEPVVRRHHRQSQLAPPDATDDMIKWTEENRVVTEDVDDVKSDVVADQSTTKMEGIINTNEEGTRSSAPFISQTHDSISELLIHRVRGLFQSVLESVTKWNETNQVYDEVAAHMSRVQQILQDMLSAVVQRRQHIQSNTNSSSSSLSNRNSLRETQREGINVRFKRELNATVDSMKSHISKVAHDVKSFLDDVPSRMLPSPRRRELTESNDDGNKKDMNVTTAKMRLSQVKPTKAAVIMKTSRFDGVRQSLERRMKGVEQHPTVVTVTSTIHNHPVASTAAASILVLGTLAWTIRARAQKSQERAEQQAASLARSQRSLDRQKSRFRSALNNSEGGVDSSVFAAVQRIKETKTSMTGNVNVNEGSDINKENDDDEDPYETQPDRWDPEVRKQWSTFIKKSKLRDANFWNADDVDEGLPEIYVDLEK